VGGSYGLAVVGREAGGGSLYQAMAAYTWPVLMATLLTACQTPSTRAPEHGASFDEIRRSLRQSGGELAPKALSKYRLKVEMKGKPNRRL
jgi:hypothetical protein